MAPTDYENLKKTADHIAGELDRMVTLPGMSVTMRLSADWMRFFGNEIVRLSKALIESEEAKNKAEAERLRYGGPQVATFLQDVDTEIERARGLYPSSRLVVAALTEEVGELAQAMLKVAAGKWDEGRVYEEAVQVAAMACRVATEGDPSFEGYTEPGDPEDEPEDDEYKYDDECDCSLCTGSDDE